jgi:hypothetical protein
MWMNDTIVASIIIIMHTLFQMYELRTHAQWFPVCVSNRPRKCVGSKIDIDYERDKKTRDLSILCASAAPRIYLAFCSSYQG